MDGQIEMIRVTSDRHIISSDTSNIKSLFFFETKSNPDQRKSLFFPLYLHLYHFGQSSHIFLKIRDITLISTKKDLVQIYLYIKSLVITISYPYWLLQNYRLLYRFRFPLLRITINYCISDHLVKLLLKLKCFRSHIESSIPEGGERRHGELWSTEHRSGECQPRERRYREGWPGERRHGDVLEYH